jgi:hypothetical protein
MECWKPPNTDALTTSAIGIGWHERNAAITCSMSQPGSSSAPVSRRVTMDRVPERARR